MSYSSYQIILQKHSTCLNLDQLTETKSMFNFLSSKITIISFCIYKSDFILLLSDGSILIYSPVTEQKTFEIIDAKTYSPFQISILLYNKSHIKKDNLLALCDNKILVINFSNYKISHEHPLQGQAQQMYLHFVDDLYLVIIQQKNKICLYNTITNNKSLCGFGFYLYYQIETDEPILTKQLLYFQNFIAFETKTKLSFYTFDTLTGNSLTNTTNSFFFNKSDNFSNELLQSNEMNMLSQNIQASSLKYKNIETYSNMQLLYSKLSNQMFIIILNKIFIIRSIYCPHKKQFIIFSTYTRLEIIDKIIRQNIIVYAVIKDPYLMIITEQQRISLYFTLDIKKCIEYTEIDISYDFLACKQISLMDNLSLIDYEHDIVHYNDIYLTNQIKKYSVNGDVKRKDYVLNSGQFALFVINSTKKKIDWVYLNSFNFHIKKLQVINMEFATKYLKEYQCRNNYNKNVSNLAYWNMQVIKQNEKFVLFKSLELIYGLIINNEYDKALFCLNELDIDLIYLLILLRKVIQSENLLLILEYYLKFSLEKYLIIINTNDIDNKDDNDNITQDKSKQIENEFQQQNKHILQLISSIDIQGIKDLPYFLKYFFNKCVEYRNNVKHMHNKKQKMIFENYSSIIMNVLNVSDINDINKLSSLNTINSYTQLKSINHKLLEMKINEDEIQYTLIENIVFILNYYAYKISHQIKYTKNIQYMIKGSYNILDIVSINMLSDINLEEEILLYYYCKGNYTKCINNIITIYERINTTNKIKHKQNEENEEDEDEQTEVNDNDNNNINEATTTTNNNNKVHSNNNNSDVNSNKHSDTEDDNDNMNNIQLGILDITEDYISNNNNNDNDSHISSELGVYANDIDYYNENNIFDNDNINTKSSNINIEKTKWLIIYINLICKISTKISQFEFSEYLKWALEKNSSKTIDLLIANSVISSKKIDESFIKTIKPYGIDPIIYYLKKFVHLEGNEQQTNEMINLYTIKIKLLQEAQDNEKDSHSTFKWAHKINKTRDDLCTFLITNKNYNISHAFDKISEIPLCQREIGIVLIQRNNYEEGIPKLFQDDNPMKAILILVEHIQEYDLVYMIIKKVIQSSNIVSKFLSEGSVEDVIIEILTKIQNKMNVVLALLNSDLFDNLDSEKITKFFIMILNVMEGKRQTYRIESSFVENSIVSQLSKLYDEKGKYVVLNGESKCASCCKKCGKGRIALDKGKVYHEECYDFLLKQKNVNEDEEEV